MSNLVHNFVVRKRKRDASFKRVVDAILEVAEGEGPDVQDIVISGSPEMGLNGQSDLENTTLVESGEASLTRSDPSDPSSRAGSWPAREAPVYPSQM